MIKMILNIFLDPFGSAMMIPLVVNEYTYTYLITIALYILSEDDINRDSNIF